MDRSGMSLPFRVLLLQIVLGSLLFLLSCQELRASSLPHRRVRRNTDAVQTTPLANELAQKTEEERGIMLLKSAEQGNLTMVRLLVQTGVNLTARTESWLGHTALHLAAMYGHAEVVKDLLRAGANPTIRDNEENLPLHYAADSGQVISRLVERGQDPDHHDRWKYTALDSSVPRDYFTVMELLLNQTSFCDVRGENRLTPLYLAAWRGHISVVRYLVSRGCQVNATNTEGKTPLHAAAEAGHVETVRALVELGAEINIKDNEGKTPVHLAVWEDRIDTVRALVELGADINTQEIFDKTPLHDAVIRNRIEIIRLLVDLGVPLNVKDKSGETPLAIARHMDYPESAAFLESRGATV